MDLNKRREFRNKKWPPFGDQEMRRLSVMIPVSQDPETSSELSEEGVAKKQDPETSSESSEEGVAKKQA